MRLLLIINLCFWGTLSAQGNPYTYADSIALSHSGRTFKNTEDMARILTKGVKDRETQFRIIFRWITDNIEYNPSMKGGDPNKALKKKEGVCAAYSHLLTTVCGHLGINCPTIVGIAKGHTSVGLDLDSPAHQHSWNAIEIDGEWKLVDVTWAAGYYDTKEKEFKKEFKPEHYFTDPIVFAERHLPDDKKWQLLDHPRHHGEFVHSPLFHAIKHHCYIELLSHKGSTIKVKEDEKIIIRFTSACKDSDDPSASIPNPDDKYEYEIQYDARQCMKSQKLTVEFNGEPMVSYRVIVKPVAQKE